MRALLLVSILGLAAAGCVSPSATPESVAPAAASDAGAAIEPTVVEWTGKVVASEIDGPSHIQPTEQAIFLAQQEGFMLDIKEVPTFFEVALAWTGDAKMMIMLHSHKEHGTNVYVEHITELDGANPKCLRVPTVDLTAGEWQVMVHSEGARNVPFKITVLTGGPSEAMEGTYHGHWLQDGSFDVDEHEIEPCQAWAPAA